VIKKILLAAFQSVGFHVPFLLSHIVAPSLP
jgi:hypothetical protein